MATQRQLVDRLKIHLKLKNIVHSFVGYNKSEHSLYIVMPEREWNTASLNLVNGLDVTSVEDDNLEHGGDIIVFVNFEPLTGVMSINNSAEQRGKMTRKRTGQKNILGEDGQIDYNKISKKINEIAFASKLTNVKQGFINFERNITYLRRASQALSDLFEEIQSQESDNNTLVNIEQALITKNLSDEVWLYKSLSNTLHEIKLWLDELEDRMEDFM